MSKTFTVKVKQQYEEACKKNKGQHEYYFCATSTGVTQRSLDLDSEFPFCEEQCREKSKNNVIKEYKLQAFLIKAALENNHLLLISGKEWIVLDAERTFVEEDLSGIGDGQRLDILAYEKATSSYVVLELKIERKLTKADKELLRYTNTLRKHIQKANGFYSVDAEKVKGYIVWPSNENPRKNDTPWGLIEYDPSLLDSLEKISFRIIKEPV
jgi:hypothetical protein